MSTCIKKNILVFAFLMLTVPSLSYAKGNETAILKDITIIISSCDKYQEFWHPFFTFLFKNWPSLKKENKDIPILLITNQKEYSDPRITIVKTGKEKTWSLNMLQTLKFVKTKYILYLQEDFMIYLPVKELVLQALLQIMKNEKPAYIELTFDSFFANEPRHPVHQDISVKTRFSKYRNALQASLWEKKVFELLLNVEENIWQFEDFGSERSQKIEQEFWIVQKNHPFFYFNACDRGYWVYPVLEYIKAQGIYIPFRRLPLDKDYPMIHWIKHYYPKLYKHFVKLDNTWFDGAFFRYEQMHD